MKKKKEKIEDSLMNILKHKKLKDIKIQEIKKKTRIKSEEFNILYKSKEQIIISFFERIDLIMEKKIKSEIFNIGPDEESISINELYKLLSNKLKFNKPAIYVDDRPNEVKDAICSSDKARKILNYNTSVNLRDSIDKVINYIKSKGPKPFHYNYNLEIENKLTPKTWTNKLF